MRTFVHLGAPFCTLIGVLVSTWGSYYLLLYYHPFKAANFWKSIRRFCLLSSTLRIQQLKQEIKVEAQLAARKAEDRTDSLTGVYLLFLGFIFQAFGAVFWCIDAALDLSSR